MKLQPWQVSVARDKTLPVRKWNHLGIFWAQTSLSAAYDAARKFPTVSHVVDSKAGDADSVVYEFDNGLFCRVH